MSRQYDFIGFNINKNTYHNYVTSLVKVKNWPLHITMPICGFDKLVFNRNILFYYKHRLEKAEGEKVTDTFML